MTTHTLTAPRATQPLPGPRALPLLGGRARMLPLLRDPVVYMRDLYRHYGPLVALSSGKRPFVFGFAPEFNRLLLSDPRRFHNGDRETLSFGPPPGTAAARLTTGLTAMNDGKHTQQRRLMMPAFHRKRVEAYHHTMVDVAAQAVAGWQPGEVRDIQREMKGIALAVAFKTLLGLDLTPAGERLRVLVEAWMRASFDPLALLLPFDVPGLPFRRQLQLSLRVERALSAMIAYKRRSGADRGDVLALLMQAHDEDGSTLSDAELIAHTLTLFVAGHETTANALTWTLFLLAQHPAVLADLRDELAVLGGAAPALDQIDALPLLDRVIKESLRLLPPAIFLLRVAMADEPFGPYTIPQGSFLFYSPPITHRLPDLYPQAERFDPARWETIHPSLYEYLPFAAGPRMCIGATFATLEMKLVLPLILARFTPVPPAGRRVDRAPGALLAPKGGLPMRLLPAGASLPRTPVDGDVWEIVTRPA